MIKNSLLKIQFLCLLVSCSTISKKSHTVLKPYTNWKEVVKVEIEKANSNLPKCAYMGERCKEQIKSINIEANKKVLDSLSKNHRTFSGFIIIDTYLQGFEYRHSSSFLLFDKAKNKTNGVTYTWYDPNPLDTDTSIPVIKREVEYKYSFLKKYFNLGHDKDCIIDCVYIITILDLST